MRERNSNFWPRSTNLYPQTSCGSILDSRVINGMHLPENRQRSMTGIKTRDSNSIEFYCRLAMTKTFGKTCYCRLLTRTEKEEKALNKHRVLQFLWKVVHLLPYPEISPSCTHYMYFVATSSVILSGFQRFPIHDMCGASWIHRKTHPFPTTACVYDVTSNCFCSPIKAKQWHLIRGSANIYLWAAAGWNQTRLQVAPGN